MDPKTPTGTKDLNSNDVYLREKIIFKIKKHFELYGGKPIVTPIIECMETIQNLYGEEFNKLVYSINDDKTINDDKIIDESISEEKIINKNTKQKLLLRYDLTVPCSRYVVNNGLVNSKLYQIGYVFRKDDPQFNKGRYRSFQQADFDIIGTDYDSLMQEIEILSLLKGILIDLLGEKKFKIRVNNKKILLNVLNFIGANMKDFDTICSSIDKLDKLSKDEIKDELINHKKIDEVIVSKLYEYIDITKNKNNSKDILNLLLLNKYITFETFNEMNLLFNYIEKFEDLNNHIFLDQTLCRGMLYYDGLIFEVEYYDKSIISSSIAAGGRYNNMLNKLGNKGIIPAIGLSIGIDRIALILEKKKKKKKKNKKILKIFIATIGQNMEIHKLILANELRKNNLNVEYFYNNTKMKQQLDYVLNKQITYMLIIGENEIKNNTIKLKIIEEHKEIIIQRNEILRFFI